MGPDPVYSYCAYWHAPSNTGRMVLKLEGDQIVQIAVDSAAELHAMGELLRTNKQCYWDREQQLLSTFWRTPGTP
jgi:hypothetical protein